MISTQRYQNRRLLKPRSYTMSSPNIISYIFITLAVNLTLFVMTVTPAFQEVAYQKRRERNILEYNRNISEAQHQHQHYFRDPKFFTLFSLSLPSSVCQADGGSVGTCMKSSKCQRQGGTGMGSCGIPFGVCCVINKACSGNGTDTVTVNGTHLTEPTSFTPFCRYEIPRQNNVCQIRLDFTDFVIDQGPDAQIFGDCTTDTLTISGASNGIVGPLCGDLSGQHVYLDYGSSDKISLDLFMQNQMSQKWDIAVTMIQCDSLEQAPTGCLQYFTSPTGIVKSFNYNNMTQLNNEDYTVCIRAQVGMRKITWKSCMTSPSTTTDFIISGGPPALNPILGNVIGTPVSGSDCSLDWVMVLGQDKYCGSQFPDSVSSTSQPFILQVHFNEYELPPPPPCIPPGGACMGGGDTPGAPQPDALNTGFCLKYSQSPF